MSPEKAETLTLGQAKMLCQRLHDRHEELANKLGAEGPFAAYFIDNFADCLRAMQHHSEGIRKCEQEIARRDGDIETKRAILAIASAHLL